MNTFTPSVRSTRSRRCRSIIVRITRPLTSHGQNATAVRCVTAGIRERSEPSDVPVFASISSTRATVKIASNEIAKSGQQNPPPPSDARTASACCAARSTAPGVSFVGTNRESYWSAIIENASDDEAGPRTMPGLPVSASCASTANASSCPSSVPVSSTMKHRSPGASMNTPSLAFTAEVITPISCRCA